MQRPAQTQTLIPKRRFTIEEYSRRFERRWGVMLAWINAQITVRFESKVPAFEAKNAHFQTKSACFSP
jgi:hypothetical protein